LCGVGVIIHVVVNGIWQFDYRHFEFLLLFRRWQNAFIDWLIAGAE
jgi:hypothetical protein